MNRQTKKILAYLTVTAIVLVLLYLSLPEPVPMEYNYARMQMGTVVEITVSGSSSRFNDDEERYDSAVEAAFREIDRLEALFSSYKETSDISLINKAAGRGPVKVDPEVVYVVARALEIAEKSGGAFDPTIGIMKKVWSFSGEKKRPIPSPAEVAALLELVDYRQIILDRETGTVALGKAGMQLNLGGLAKGYIVGQAVKTLKEGGIKRGIVKAGGDMVVFDEESRPFNIGLQHPRQADMLIGELAFTNEAVATSGDYERFTIRDGVRYHHILDPTTGFPARGTQAVTLLSADPTLADALSTTVFVLGPAKGMALIESLPNVEGMIIDETGEIAASSGLKERLLLKESSNESGK